MRLSIRFALCVFLLVLTAVDAHADKRVALVIGNGAYRNVPALPNPPHDAVDVAAARKRSGFDVELATDQDQEGMQDATIRFAREAHDADVALFYYSGHALQFGGVNYLVPVDAVVHDEVDLRRLTRADEILADLQQAKNLRILVLDACRDNPFADNLRRSVGKGRGINISNGLAKMESPEGTIISYATQSGRTANDGDGRNSPYTTAFLKHIQDRDNITTVFQTISANVYEETKGDQLPELSLSFFGQFYLNGKPAASSQAATPQVDPCAEAAEHWHSAEALGTVAAFKDHLLRFPNCAFADLAKSRIADLSNPSGPAKAANPFDGLWVVKETCQRKPPYFPAANLQYALRIKDGILHSTFGEEGKPGSSIFDGKIEADGTAKITVSGYTSPAKDPLHRPAGTPFHYSLALDLKGTSGTGVRTETPRPCRQELTRMDATSTKEDENPSPKLPDDVSRAGQETSGKPAAVQAERSTPQSSRTGNGMSCSFMQSRCAAACAAKTGIRDCASTICVRLEAHCMSTGCWTGRGFSGCGLARR